MNHNKTFFLIIFFLLFVSEVYPNTHLKEKPERNESSYWPDYLKQHLGSYQGLFAIGFGYSFFSYIWELDMLYNYTPKYAGGRDIHSISLRNSINPYSFTISNVEIRPIYLGTFFIFGLDKDLDYTLPSRYPSNYYPPTAIRLGLHLGFELIYLEQPFSIKKYSFSMEYTIHDVGISALFSESYLSWEDVVTWGFGFKLYL